MMEYISAISYFLTNEVRLFLGLFLVAKVMNFLPKRMLLLLSAAGGVLVTALQMAGLPTIGVLTIELLVITAVTWYCLRDKLNLCLFLIFFYEVGVGLWDFLLQAGLGIMFRSENFINPNAMEYLAGIWLVRLLMLIGSITLIKQEHPNAGTLRALSVLVILGMFGAVTLSEQTILPLNEDQVGTWIILSIILLFAILFYRVNQQREMEAEIAKLKQEQAEIVERDYQALRRTYADNAKLYHDLHNHIEAIYRPCDPLFEHPNLYAAILRPGFGTGDPYAARTGGAILPEVLSVYLCSQRHCRQYLPLQLADRKRRF